MADWDLIREEYLSSDLSFRGLALKFGLSASAVGAHARKEGWAALRLAQREKDPAAAAVPDPEAQKRIGSIAGKLLGKLEGYVDGIAPELCEPKDLKQVSATLKDIRDVLMLQSKLDAQEQRYRIEKLRLQAKQESQEQAVLIVEGLPEEFKA